MTARPLRKETLLAALAMMGAAAASNYLVQFEINTWLTWGSFFYPVTFCINELTNRRFGPACARRAVYAGFASAVVVSLSLAPPRIVAASGIVFLTSQLLDIQIFTRLRRGSWWLAPIISSVSASAVDTGLFFPLAFLGTPVPWWSLAVGDFFVKFGMDLLMLAPFRAALGRRALRPVPNAPDSVRETISSAGIPVMASFDAGE